MVHTENMGWSRHIRCVRDEAERKALLHESSSHPEVQCQCLECLYARELAAQCRAWLDVAEIAP